MINRDDLWIKSMEWCRRYCGCHQIPERSFFFKGYQLPLCARCTGIALGHALAIISAPFRTYKYSVALLMIPLAIDGTMQYSTSYESNNFKRIVSGFLYGFAFTSVVIRALKTIFKH